MWPNLASVHQWELLDSPGKCQIFKNFPEWDIPTNRPRVFHVEMTWKQSFPRRFNVEYMWCVCRARCKFFTGDTTKFTGDDMKTQRGELRNMRFSDVFRGYRKATQGCNGFKLRRIKQLFDRFIKKGPCYSVLIINSF